MDLKTWFGSSGVVALPVSVAQLSSVLFALGQDVQSEFFIGFHPVPCKALVLTHVFLRAIMVWRRESKLWPGAIVVLHPEHLQFSLKKVLWLVKKKLGKHYCLAFCLCYFIQIKKMVKMVYLAINNFGFHSFNIMKEVR